MKANLQNINQSTSLELLAKQMVEGFISGLHKSPYHGFSVEFAEHRVYNEGESTRHIDWKVFARTDRLFTKRYEEETNLRCLIAIDVSPSMFYPEATHAKLKFSLFAAAALAFLLQKQRDAVGLCFFSDKIETLTQVKSTPSHLKKLLTSLEEWQERKPSKQVHNSNVAEVLHAVAEKIHKRSLVILFSDMFDSTDQTDELFKALQHLKHNKHEVIVFNVMDNKTELAFDFEDRPMEFIDLESTERIRLNPAEIKTNYIQSVQQFHSTLKMKCNQYKIDFIEADTQLDFDTILQTYLIKRGKMR